MHRRLAADPGLAGQTCRLLPCHEPQVPAGLLSQSLQSTLLCSPFLVLVIHATAATRLGAARHLGHDNLSF